MLLLFACADPPPSECEGAPVLTWANFGAGFLLERCAGCHSSATVDRYGAPEAVTLDTVDEAWLHRDAILALSAGDDAEMPPGGPAPADEREKLVIWLTCAEEGT